MHGDQLGEFGLWILGLKGSKPTQILAYSEMN